MIINVDIDVIGGLGHTSTKHVIVDANDVMEINWLWFSPVSSLAELTFFSSVELFHEQIEMLLFDWVYCLEKIPVNESVARWCGD